ncbi:MAG: hypothetical protein Ct9H300mP1_03300 [Planctomycetaceae bacterium]|nr:MAG: hypothetical protein Ct9H300mP1_03300 [Planctomycetaceae bacterium]
MNTFDFHRSFFTFRIDTLVKQPLTVTHKPPFSLNNARIPIECRCVVPKRPPTSPGLCAGGQLQARRLGEGTSGWNPSDFCPIFSDDRYLSLKTYSQVDDDGLFPPGSGRNRPQTGIEKRTTA